MENASSKDIQYVADFYRVDLNQGLTNAEANQARLIHGNNEIAADPGTPLWKLILKQFDDLLVKILIVAAIVDLVISFAEGGIGLSAVIEPGVIVLILIANAAVGVITENRAEQAIEELKAYEADVSTVLREGKLSLIPAAELVPGDVVEVTVGGKIPADIRISQIMSSQLRVDQSILTGESDSVAKSTQAVMLEKQVYQDQSNILFSGTVITAGRAKGIVVGTGTNTAIGKIRDAMAEQEEEMTPLKKKLDQFGEFLSKVIAGICVLVWLVNINHFADPIHGGIISGAIYYFKISVALAVAAIPEGLPAVVTTCLALGTRKMAKQNAIVRSLPSVETLGCTTVICSDKTGTITTNSMTVLKIATIHKHNHLDEFDVTGVGYETSGGGIRGSDGKQIVSPSQQACLLSSAVCCALCNDSWLEWVVDKQTYQRIGESTEVAIRILAEKIGLPGYGDMPDSLSKLTKQERTMYCNQYWKDQYQKIQECEFSRDRKMMSVLTLSPQNGKLLFVKGAPENVVGRCKDCIIAGGGTQAMTPECYNAVLTKVGMWGATSALRCLALAMKTLPGQTDKISPEDEVDLTFIGIVGMQDPPRAEVQTAIEVCKNAGIRVIMVTGDNKATAVAVANQIGLLQDLDSDYVGGDLEQAGLLDESDGLRVQTGVEFDNLPNNLQQQAVDSLRVFCRVEPTHKQKLVELLKYQKQVVAMTGDGVNDAPALKRADIGVAMGSGTAVAKHASDMVLADDNFATIVSAVREGRAIFNNTKSFIRYMVSSNIGEVVAIFTAALLGLPGSLTPVQLLWVNLVTDGLPATALGFNKPDKDIMITPPRRTDDAIVNKWLFIRYLVIGGYVGIVTIYGYIWWFISFENGPKLTWTQLTHSKLCAKEGSEIQCSVYNDQHPSTISMSVLVIVEMFNALNALSENGSLLQIPPWSNPMLLGAILLSILLHMFILTFGPATVIFGVTQLSTAEWIQVIKLSFPVIIVDEVLKLCSRIFIDPYTQQFKFRWFRKDKKGAPLSKKPSQRKN